MSDQLVITALGDDRPGIVDELTTTLLEHKLNIEDSRMSILGGEFAILLLITGSSQNIDTFIKNKTVIEESLNMQLLIKPTSSEVREKSSDTYSVKVVAIDHPGIVQNLASFFSSRGINIVDLKTKRYSAAHTATPMFSVNITVNVPVGQSSEQLHTDFIAVCDELNLDATQISGDNK